MNHVFALCRLCGSLHRGWRIRHMESCNGRRTSPLPPRSSCSGSSGLTFRAVDPACRPLALMSATPEP